MPQFSKPVRRPGDVIESWYGKGDPAEVTALSHDTAAALLHRVRAADDPALVERIVAYADEHGVDDVAELWAAARADSLPGTLWRVYLLRHLVVTRQEWAAMVFRRGTTLDQVNQAIAGAPALPTPAEVVQVATEILRGAFTGDFAVALERGGAFCRVLAAGALDLADTELDQARRASLTSDAQTCTSAAGDLRHSALLWRQGQLI